jgi:putative nucleotidyltransferase with HDIG domain
MTANDTPFLTFSSPTGWEQAREVALLLAEAAATSMGHYPDHPFAVANLSGLVGVELGLSEEALEALILGALLHDVGKLGVPEAVLQKSGSLTHGERGIIRRHSDIGARIVEQIWCLRKLAPAIRYHHERYDGSGYPDGLVAEEIPLPARIVAAADAYDAMVSRRHYRSRSRPPTEAIGELTSRAGSQFDAEVVTALRQVKASLAVTPTLQNSPSAHFGE